MTEAYLLIGLGVWLGLVPYHWYSALTFGRWEQWALGFVLTVFLWPVALYTNWQRAKKRQRPQDLRGFPEE